MNKPDRQFRLRHLISWCVIVSMGLIAGWDNLILGAVILGFMGIFNYHYERWRVRKDLLAGGHA
jgi:hypothetical protein